MRQKTYLWLELVELFRRRRAILVVRCFRIFSVIDISCFTLLQVTDMYPCLQPVVLLTNLTHRCFDNVACINWNPLSADVKDSLIAIDPSF